MRVRARVWACSRLWQELLYWEGKRWIKIPKRAWSDVGAENCESLRGRREVWTECKSMRVCASAVWQKRLSQIRPVHLWEFDWVWERRTSVQTFFRPDLTSAGKSMRVWARFGASDLRAIYESLCGALFMSELGEWQERLCIRSDC